MGSPQQQQHQNENVMQQQNEVMDPTQIICSFHRDFIPEMKDLKAYFSRFGELSTNFKLEIEYDSKKVPLAKIKYSNKEAVNKVIGQGNRQQIPSGAANGNIHIRVYRSMNDYKVNTQRQNHNHRSNHGQFHNNNKHKNGHRGGNGGRGRG